MKVHILIEHHEAWGGPPDEMDDIILGVFLTREDTLECLEQHISYLYTQGTPEIALDGDVAIDAEGNQYFAIIQREIGSC